ncbi:hypothetical protein [Pontibacillus salipaludis]|uniref:hypothetical protein n=1 Tax=Pontibacillus salipaludis TaxID=1697394 RepID=UPI0031E60FD8
MMKDSQWYPSIFAGLFFIGLSIGELLIQSLVQVNLYSTYAILGSLATALVIIFINTAVVIDRKIKKKK